jgi:hypothetical protein
MVTAIAILLASVSATQGRVPAAPVEIGLPVLTMTGDHSRTPGPRAVVCGDQKAFDAVWSRHTGQSAKVYYSSHPAPVLDFKHFMVVLVFEGAGYNSQGVAFEPVTKRGDSLVIRFKGLPFQTAGPDGGGVLVQPWGLAVLPRTDRKLVVEEAVLQMGGPPKAWKKFAEIGITGPTDSYKSEFN